MYFLADIQRCIHRNALWSYLDIYISQNIRLWRVILSPNFKQLYRLKILNFLIWKFKSIILIFLLFFAWVVKSSAFCTHLILFQRVEICTWIAIWSKNVTQTIQPFQNSISSVQKALNLTTPVTNRMKIRMIDLNDN